ncbi:DUF2851 family protein [Algibacter miyuki]|uniref:DUF2851 family protein n=1 Tax=Algibacter miyuki TaxID=1306933 RepID=A0ABV5H235_9FLAO|nr:DUF2851 family protein [Algibacter miyuki]MDN3666371.1 DUF2851 family protein [Algibacter miyuki]
MQEDFLHYIWKFKKFETHNLKTEEGLPVTVKQVGQHNFNSGPDFFNAKLEIGEQLWAGNVEIHVKSSDWYLHNHEQDLAYDGVIMHVVWEHDTEIFRKDNTAIPTLQIRDYIDFTLLNNYKKLFAKSNTWINCENDFAKTDEFVLAHWIERLYFERLQRKTDYIETLLQESRNDWEAVLFKMLAKNFGLKVNGDAFFSLAQSIDFSVVRKSQSDLQRLEALLFGQSNLLSETFEDAYFISLSKEYNFLKQKFGLENKHVLPLQFFRLRPPNFPTIRLSQLANLYHQHQNIFSKIIETDTLEDFYKLFNVETSEFWKTHYTFKKESKPTSKGITKSFTDLLLINTILPLKFCYAKQMGHDIDSTILQLASEIHSEKNSVIDAFNRLKKISKSALQSQSLLQLKTEYCDKNKCLQCAVGNALLTK